MKIAQLVAVSKLIAIAKLNLLIIKWNVTQKLWLYIKLTKLHKNFNTKKTKTEYKIIIQEL